MYASAGNRDDIEHVAASWLFELTCDQKNCFAQVTLMSESPILSDTVIDTSWFLLECKCNRNSGSRHQISNVSNEDVVKNDRWSLHNRTCHAKIHLHITDIICCLHYSTKQQRSRRGPVFRVHQHMLWITCYWPTSSFQWHMFTIQCVWTSNERLCNVSWKYIWCKNL